MSSVVRTATADNKLEEIDHHFEFVSGLPVVDEELVCIGIVSKEDKARASNGVSLFFNLFVHGCVRARVRVS